MILSCRWGCWFGYRPNYQDIFKIWISSEAIDWYGYITRATMELRDEIGKMKEANQTPSDFGLKVRQDPDYSLLVTARNKMAGMQLLLPDQSLYPAIFWRHLV